MLFTVLVRSLILNVLEAQALRWQRRSHQSVPPQHLLWEAAAPGRIERGGNDLGRREAHADHGQRASDDANHLVQKAVALEDEVDCVAAFHGYGRVTE